VHLFTLPFCHWEFPFALGKPVLRLMKRAEQKMNVLAKNEWETTLDNFPSPTSCTGRNTPTDLPDAFIVKACGEQHLKFLLIP